MKNNELFNTLNIFDIHGAVMSHIEGCFLSLGPSEFQPTMICIVGSRLNGTHSGESDLDIAIAYRGTLREDDCFNGLMEEPLFFEDIKVDFIPYSEQIGNGIDLDRPHYLLFSEDAETIFQEEKMNDL
ncbi:hypothetical protein FAY30_26035 (plasmid) [Bacillus sp. S3]|uniref:nucleotidyltransferase domain-containing protein n=1 Tax=Bacillus sp. S3 TaxID=486398 RepID=UPI00118A693F|nr:nucleotidyltransferase domain-containing protein [Bacillus sp. S3]QCJ45415.1 hypothetical protein FAY30_26035 [Bacillus sp. S3]